MHFRNWITLLFLMGTSLTLGQQFDVDKNIIYQDVFSPRAFGMGRAGTALPMAGLAPAINPAGWAKAQQATAVISGVLNVGDTRLEPPQSVQNTFDHSINQRGDATLNYAGFVVPTAIGGRRIVAGILLRNAANFRSNKSLSLRDDRNGTHQNTDYTASGGLYILGVGLAGNMTNSISGGISLNMVTGRYGSKMMDYFAAANDTINSWEDWSNSFSGVFFEAGLMWQPTHTFALASKVTFPYRLKISDISYANSNGKRMNFELDAQVSRPLTISYGIGLFPLESLTLALDYHFMPFDKAGLTVNNTTTNGYFSSSHSFHVGVEYMFRDGATGFPIRWGFFSRPEQVKNYSAEEEGSQVTGRYLSAGFGLLLNSVNFNLSMEYMIMGYEQDIAGTNQPYGVRESRLRILSGMEISL